MSEKPAFISISLPPILRERVEERLLGSDFGNVSEYVRSLIRADLARFDYEQLLKERLEHAAVGDPIHEEVKALVRAKARGETPAVLPSFADREEAFQQIRDAKASVRPTPAQAGKPVEAQEQELFEIVEAQRHGRELEAERQLDIILSRVQPHDDCPERSEDELVSEVADTIRQARSEKTEAVRAPDKA